MQPWLQNARGSYDNVHGARRLDGVRATATRVFSHEPRIRCVTGCTQGMGPIGVCSRDWQFLCVPSLNV